FFKRRIILANCNYLYHSITKKNQMGLPGLSEEDCHAHIKTDNEHWSHLIETNTNHAQPSTTPYTALIAGFIRDG
ncbi:MAG: hypothetical protein U9O53_00200, partial [archaeon]|nr:hypothetical protein [archaeon]